MMTQGQKKFSGVIVPMITPFTKSGQIDQDAVKRITEHIVKNGASPFVLGTTGESASIADDLRPSLVETMVKTVAGRSATFIGIASNCFQGSIDAAKRYFDLGVDAVVAHLPCYYPLTDDAILAYFETLADAVPLPLILYNIPATTHISIPLDVIEKLSHHPNVFGLKDSQRDLQRLEIAIEMWRERTDFSYFIGWAAQSANGLALGADGIVPSTGNVVPGLFSMLYRAVKNNEMDVALHYQKMTEEIAQIYQQGRILSQALPALKVMMYDLGFCEPYVLPPLQETRPQESKEIIEKTAAVNLRESVL